MTGSINRQEVAAEIADHTAMNGSPLDHAADKLLDVLALPVRVYDEQRRADWDAANKGELWDGLS